MNRNVMRAAVLATTVAALPWPSSAAGLEDCKCIHQEARVNCPANLQAGSRSIEVVPGGTMWLTPQGQNVFVPQTTFACAQPPPTLPPVTLPPPIPPAQTPTAPTPPTERTPSTPLMQTPKPPAAQTPTMPPTGAGRGAEDRAKRLMDPQTGPATTALPAQTDDRKATDDLIQRLGREVKEPPAAAPPANGLKEDPVISCYRSARAPMTDTKGVVHDDSLYLQLVSASGIRSARLENCGGTCRAPAYDCGGTFYDAAGKPVKVPPLPADARSGADVNTWKAGVAKFYATARVEPKGQPLSAGKAALCSKWAEVYFQTKPDPSVLQALQTLQQTGAEAAVQQDTKWLNGIGAAGTAKGCGALPMLPTNVVDSWWVPNGAGPLFLGGFRDCSKPDTSGVGGCPHAFDAPTGNRVNARHLFGANGVSAFISDALKRCGVDCYRQANQPQNEKQRDAACTAKVSECIGACEKSNAVLSSKCIESGGSPTGGQCVENVAACSCTQTTPECKKGAAAKGSKP